MYTVQSGALSCEKGFEKCFPRLPQAVGLYLRLLCCPNKQARGTLKHILKNLFYILTPQTEPVMVNVYKRRLNLGFYLASYGDEGRGVDEMMMQAQVDFLRVNTSVQIL